MRASEKRSYVWIDPVGHGYGSNAFIEVIRRSVAIDVWDLIGYNIK